MLAFAIRLGTFSCRGYGKLVVALQNCHEKIVFVIEGRSFKDGIQQDIIAA